MSGIVRRKNGYPLDGLFGDMDNVFNSIFDNDFFATERGWTAAPMSALSRRTYRLTTSENNMSLSIDVPGVKAQDVAVDAQGHEVHIVAKRGEHAVTYRYMINETYDMTSLKASLEDGVLTLSLDKKLEVQPRKIEVVVAQK